MSDAPTPAACAEVRRRDREVTDEAWIKEFLRRAPAGTLATAAGGQPFVNMNIFVYSEPDHAIYLHTAKSGRTRANVDGEERVCFSVSEMGRLLPAKTALEMSVEYAGVVVFGRAEIVADAAEAECALNLLLAKYFPHLEAGRDFRPVQPEELARTSVYRIRIDAWSGKRKSVAADFPGAFRYGEWPTPATPPNGAAGILSRDDS
jgi:nitroimidazol reductase NimA-like FMN-containing flavoprotein (pyridoxamine 5'-phosphate oxidase superfamily)